MCTGIGNGSAGGRPGPNLPSTSSAQTLPKVTWPDQLLDVDAAVAQRAAVLVRLGDLGLERDDPCESGAEIVWHATAPIACQLTVCPDRPADGSRVWRLRRQRSATTSIVTHPPDAGQAPVQSPWSPGTLPDRAGTMAGDRPAPSAAESANAEDPLARLAGARRSYRSGELTEDALAPTWLEQLRLWFGQATADARIGEPNAMQVATADADGRPDLRTVLARGFDDAGVVFYTNYDSAKGAAAGRQPGGRGAVLLAAAGAPDPAARAGGQGRAGRDRRATSPSRPRGAQLAAWASPQSEPLAGRAELERRLAEVAERFGDGEIPPPPHWGGYRITVTEVEFWQGREFRLHDRLRYRQVTRPTTGG